MFGGWVQDALAAILVGCVDRLVYWLASAAFDVFQIASRINIFGGEGKMMDIYNGFTDRIYTALSIVMVFVFAYKMLMMIIDPDGNKQNTTGLIKDVVITIACIVIMPLLFRYMTVFQNHVIDENIIFKFVLGTDGDFDSSGNAGRDLSMIVLMSFYHPYDLDSTFFSPITQKVVDSGNTSVIDKVKKDCIESLKENDNVDDHHWFQTENGIIEETCNQYTDGIVSWRKSKNNSPGKLLANDGIYGHIDETMDYYWILCTGAGVMLCWFFISYALDLGTRAVKLAFLEVIAPIPLVMRIIPNAKKSFDTWKNEIIKTYLEVFIRVAVIAFIVQLCIMVPIVITSLFDSIKNIEGNLFVKIISTVILILGLLKFAKDAPSLFKAIFTTGGTLFDGLNLKAGVKSRIEDNPYAMKGLSYGASAAGRTRALFRTNYEDAQKQARFQNGKTGRPSKLKSAAWGAWGVLSHGGNILTGSFKDNMGDKSATSLKDMKGQMQNSGRLGKQESLNTIAENESFEAGANKGFFTRVGKKAYHNSIGAIKEGAHDFKENWERNSEANKYIYGGEGDFSAAAGDFNDAKVSNKTTYAPFSKTAEKEEARINDMYKDFVKELREKQDDANWDGFKMLYTDENGNEIVKKIKSTKEFNDLKKRSVANAVAQNISKNNNQRETIQYQMDTLANLEKIYKKDSSVAALVDQVLASHKDINGKEAPLSFDSLGTSIQQGLTDNAALAESKLVLDNLISSIDSRVEISTVRNQQAQTKTTSSSSDKK